MERCLADGLVEIDNNLMENSLRPIAVGRKNWLFFGSREAGQKSAVLFTIVEWRPPAGADMDNRKVARRVRAA